MTTVADSVNRTLWWSKKLNCERGDQLQFWGYDMRQKSHLQYIIGEFEDNGVLHSIVFHQKVKVLCPWGIHESPIRLMFQSTRHVLLKVLQQVDFALDVRRKLFIDSMVLPYRAWTFSCDVVEVTVAAVCEYDRIVRRASTHLLFGDRTIVVESLK